MRAGKYLLIIMLLVITGRKVYCQLAPFQDEDAIVTPIFQENIIKDKKIAQITMHYFSKPDDAPITDQGIMLQYFFDTAGKIVESINMTKADNHIWDSVKCQYYYDGYGNISIKRTQMDDFYDTWYYKWNKEGQLQTEDHVHETNALSTGGDFKIATQKVMSADSFAYIPYPKQLQQYAYNEDNKIFRKTIIQYDEKRRIVSRNSHYVVGWLYSEVDFTYDDMGRIIRYVNSGNMNGDKSQSTIIKYDSSGRPDEQGIWNNGKQIHHIEYMYDGETGLISNKLDRDSTNASISIVRFSYKMYNDEGYSRPNGKAGRGMAGK